MELGRFLRTVGHLRPSQVAWRLRFTVARRLEESAPVRYCRRGGDSDRIGELRQDWDQILKPLMPNLAASCDHAQELEDGKLTLLGETRPFMGWEGWTVEGGQTGHRLWKFHLHYHRWLFDLAREGLSGGSATWERILVNHLQAWIATCTPRRAGFTHCAWHSYVIATRIRWWCALLCILPRSFWNGRSEFFNRLLGSLYRQAGYLESHLEWDLRGNHLIRDALGLACAGILFSCARGRRWRERARVLLESQLEEQFLSDGGHFERSPMYHLQVMEDVGLIRGLLPEAEAGIQMKWPQMAEFALWVSHPDGRVALLNDSSPEADLPVNHIVNPGQGRDASSVPVRPRGGRHLASTGLAVWQGDPWTLFFDIGKIGPDYQPGHAHADTLSFECSFGPYRLVVDPGTYGYERDECRRYDRSTSAHNTIAIDGRDSSEVWEIFRTGRRAVPQDVAVEVSTDGLDASATHSGYDHLPGRPRHRRRIRVQNSGRVEIVDQVNGRGLHTIEGGLLIEPKWQVQRIGDRWELSQGTCRLFVTFQSTTSMRLSLEKRRYHPSFGVELQAPRISWAMECELPVEVVTVLEGS